VVSFTPRPLYPRGKRPRYPLDRRLDGLQSRSGCGGEEKKSLHCPCRVSKAGRSALSLVTVLTELPRLVLIFCFVIYSSYRKMIQIKVLKFNETYILRSVSILYYEPFLYDLASSRCYIGPVRINIKFA